MTEKTQTFIPISKFGKDHWSTFAYIDTRIVDYKGKPDRKHMRCDQNRHPHYAHLTLPRKYPTILKGGIKWTDHDDWDCLDDLVNAGLLHEPADRGTGMFPVYELTKLGVQIATQLRTHKSKGKNFTEFDPTLLIIGKTYFVKTRGGNFTGDCLKIEGEWIDFRIITGGIQHLSESNFDLGPGDIKTVRKKLSTFKEIE